MTGGASHEGKLAAAGIILAAAFVMIFLLRRGEPVQPRVSPAAEPAGATATAPAQSLPSAIDAPNEEAVRLQTALAEAQVSVTEAERVIDGSTASLDLPGLLAPSNLGNTEGRKSLLVMLDRAEEISNLRRQVTEQNLERVRAAATAAPVAPAVSQDFVQAFDAQAVRTLRTADQLHETELQSVSTARRMIAFMEQHQSSYQVRGESLTFSSQGMQVQYMHYLTQVGQLLQRQTRARGLAVAARQDQARLVESLAGG